MSSRDLFFNREAADGCGPVVDAPSAGALGAAVAVVEAAAAGAELVVLAAPEVVVAEAAGAAVLVEPLEAVVEAAGVLPSAPKRVDVGAAVAAGAAVDVFPVELDGAAEAPPRAPNKPREGADVAGADVVADADDAAAGAGWATVPAGVADEAVLSDAGAALGVAPPNKPIVGVDVLVAGFGVADALLATPKLPKMLPAD